MRIGIDVFRSRRISRSSMPLIPGKLEATTRQNTFCGSKSDKNSWALSNLTVSYPAAWAPEAMDSRTAASSSIKQIRYLDSAMVSFGEKRATGRNAGGQGEAVRQGGE